MTAASSHLYRRGKGGTCYLRRRIPAQVLDSYPSGVHLGYRMMALEVDEMQTALDAVKAKGVECASGPIVRPAYVRAEIRDPDGNPIESRQSILMIQNDSATFGTSLSQSPTQGARNSFTVFCQQGKSGLAVHELLRKSAGISTMEKPRMQTWRPRSQTRYRFRLGDCSWD